MRRLAYDEAIARYGTDKPDLRFGLEPTSSPTSLRESEFNAFRKAIEGGAIVRGLNAGRRELSRGELDGLVDEATELGAKGLVWAVVEGAAGARLSPSSSLKRSLGGQREARGHGRRRSPDRRGRTAFSAEVLGEPRRRLGERLGLIERGAHELTWIVDWPCLAGPRTRSAGTRQPPSPRPRASSIPAIQARRAKAYDVVWNGWEIGGGSIRISDPDVQRKVFAAIGIDEEQAEERSASCSRRCVTARPRTGDRLWARPDRRPAPRNGLDQGGDRLPEDGLRRRSAHRSPGGGGRGAAARPRSFDSRRGRGLTRDGRARSTRGRRGIRVD